MFNIIVRFVIGIALIVGIGIPSVRAQAGVFDFLKDQNIGKMAPDFTLDTLGAKNVNMTRLREGKKAIVFFWATWCPHCRMALKDLNGMAKDIEKKNIRLILVDLGETPDQVIQYAQKNKITSDIFLDQKSSLAEPYGIIGVPTFIFVGADGKIKSAGHSLPKDYETIF